MYAQLLFGLEMCEKDDDVWFCEVGGMRGVFVALRLLRFTREHLCLAVTVFP